MPKKFKGGNPKAEAAKARKEEAKVEKAAKAEREKEDAYWRSLEEEDKHAMKKGQRKAEREQKRLEASERKAANAELLKAEEAKTKGKERAEKVTRASIARARDDEKATAAAAKKKEEAERPIEENPNRLVADYVTKEGIVEARSIDEAVAALSVDEGGASDMHPEKRVRAAYAVFEARELDRLKAENPSLRLSQLKQMLRKMWAKSPDNPLNG
ncbi:coiled-coil domain-containing protein 124-like [Oscarella lobularis]|uniref:coiled-coil domain-containing protein 124-like n=1 Tax=Oscarella lobularis TaxID=121494 RepID=UPI0033140156